MTGTGVWLLSWARPWNDSGLGHPVECMFRQIGAGRGGVLRFGVATAPVCPGMGEGGGNWDSVSPGAWVARFLCATLHRASSQVEMSARRS
jgi:hypothetical protein